MTSPQPPTTLSGDCSVIEDGVLYSFAPVAFQSLPLSANGTWSNLPIGVPVQGASCVLQPGVAMWVVGGASPGTVQDYSGLQRYSFSNQTWETITYATQDFQGRQGHAAAYLPQLGSILVYSGARGSSNTPSTATFLLSTTAPYTIKSFGSRNTPVVSPLLLAWDDLSAITVGGSETNKNVYRFQDYIGWQRILPALPGPLKSSSVEQATLIQGTDGSKVLQLYDMSTVPANMTSIVLQTADGEPAPKGTYLGAAPSASGSSNNSKRGLALSSWPTYNDTNAPASARSGYALASATGGMVAIAGGGDVSQPVALFNSNQNSWINTTSFFAGSTLETEPVDAVSTTAAPASSATTAPVSSVSPRPTSPYPSQPPFVADKHPEASKILGATLGSILAFILLLVGILLFLRYRRKKLAAKRALAVQGDDTDDEKDRMSIVDRGDPLARQAAGPAYPGSQQSLANQNGQQQSSHQRSSSHESDRSTRALVPQTYEMNSLATERPNLAAATANQQSSSSLQVPGTQQNRSSGWSRYWSGTEGQASSNRSSAVSNAGPDPRPASNLGTHPALLSHSNNDNSENLMTFTPPQQHSRVPGSVTPTGPQPELPPLDMGQEFHETRVSKQMTGQNTQDDYRPRTISSNISDAAEVTNWTPMPQGRYNTNSVYSHGSGPGPEVSSPRSATGLGVVGSGPYKPMPSRTNTNGAQQPRVVSGAYIVSPTAVDQRPRNGQSPTVNEDMSWLNLGSSGHNSQTSLRRP